IDEIKEILQKFGDAALRARQAGFDGVEFHAAHAYMLAGSFLSALKNRRSDEYGGTVEGRLRFCREAIESIKRAAGNDFPVIMRISADELVPGGRTVRETQYILPRLVASGVDAFHVSAGVYPDTSWRVIPPAGTPLGINTSLSRMIKEATDVPVMVVGRITSPGLAEDILQREEADLVVLGRALLADPEFVNKAREGRDDDIAPCIGCGLGCVTNRELGGDMTCLVNPAVGREEERPEPAAKKKRIMVVGAGPAGLEFSRAAARRGHEVTLYEKDDRPGGQLNLAAVVRSKREILGLIRHQVRQAEKAGVGPLTGVEVTAAMIQEQKPDAVVIATGARTCTPGICGFENCGILCSREVLAGGVDIDSGKVLIIGGGMVGCEVAEFLASPGDSVSETRTEVAIIEMNEGIGLDMFSEARYFMINSLREKGVRLYTGSTVTELFDDGAAIERGGKKIELRGFDYLVNATGAQPANELASSLESYSGEVYTIGDAREPRQALHAIAEAWDLGNKI
nr:NAD(P)/FAD-dependent oxidoreductase [Spirochaetota bacterium]